MAFESEFLELMVQTCTLTPPASNNGYGETVTWGTPITPKCHVEYQTRHVAHDNLVVVEEGVVYLAGSFAVETNWALTVPVPGGTKAVKIISVDQNADEEGFHHTAVHFGAF